MYSPSLKLTITYHTTVTLKLNCQKVYRHTIVEGRESFYNEDRIRVTRLI